MDKHPAGPLYAEMGSILAGRRPQNRDDPPFELASRPADDGNHFHLRPFADSGNARGLDHAPGVAEPEWTSAGRQRRGYAGGPLAFFLTIEELE